MNKTPTPEPAKRARMSYRTDIDGLRGLAIALVVFFHIFIGRVSSGVDVFLLVGGVFFFGSQIRNALNPQGMTILQSIWRIFQRLYPALVAVTGVTLLIAVLLYPPLRWAEISADATASLLYVQNFHLAALDNTYEAIHRDASVFQHIWSMSVQFQIYIGSLLAIFALALLLKLFRLKRDAISRLLGTLVLLATIASFIYAIYLNQVDQGWNYYSPLSRFWEVGLGGLVGMWLVGRSIPARFESLRMPAATLGLLLIILTGVFINGAEQFPGSLTLIPLLGAVLIILAGNRTESESGQVGINKMFTTPIFQFLGKISYSLYLWHWPLLVLATFAFTNSTANIPTGESGITAILGPVEGTLVGLGVIAASIALAWITYRFVETPLRQKEKPSRSWVINDPSRLKKNAQAATATGAVAFVALSSGGVVVSNYALTAMTESIQQAEETAAAAAQEIDPEEFPGPAAITSDLDAPLRTPIPDPNQPSNTMVPQTGADGCTAFFEHTEPILTQDRNNSDEPCEYGDVESEETIYLVGHSHAEHFLPALDVVAQNRGVKIIPHIKMGCSFGGPSLRTDGTDYPECGEWQDNVTEHILENPPTNGVFMLSSSPEPGTVGPDVVPEGYVEKVRLLTEAGIHTWGLRDSPWPSDGENLRNARECAASEDFDVYDAEADCSTPRSAALADENPALNAYEGLDITLLDLSNSFCTTDRCPAVVGNVLVYRDSSHVTDVFSQLLAPELEQQMFPVDD